MRNPNHILSLLRRRDRRQVGCQRLVGKQDTRGAAVLLASAARNCLHARNAQLWFTAFCERQITSAFFSRTRWGLTCRLVYWRPQDVRLREPSEASVGQFEPDSPSLVVLINVAEPVVVFKA
jgi:hypothetical protein